MGSSGRKAQLSVCWLRQAASYLIVKTPSQPGCRPCGRPHYEHCKTQDDEGKGALFLSCEAAASCLRKEVQRPSERGVGGAARAARPRGPEAARPTFLSRPPALCGWAAQAVRPSCLSAGPRKKSYQGRIPAEATGPNGSRGEAAALFLGGNGQTTGSRTEEKGSRRKPRGAQGREVRLFPRPCTRANGRAGEQREGELSRA